jgi:GT2 family glycosyltransferase
MDNGSIEKKTLDYFKALKKYKNIIIKTINKPFNYSYLNNEGVKISHGEYIVLLNNDIQIISKNWLEVLLGYAMQSHIGAVGPKLLFANNKIQHVGVVLGVGEGHIANHAFYLEDKLAPAPAGRLIVPYNYSAVTGACIMISKKKYNEVNGLEEKLAVNYNDVDFCMKLLEKGYFNVLLPQIELYHLESLSRGKINNEDKLNQLHKEQEFMRKKWKEKLLVDRFYNPNYSSMYCFKLDKNGGNNER